MKLTSAPNSLVPADGSRRQMARCQRHPLGRGHRLRRRSLQLPDPPRQPRLPGHLRSHRRPLPHAHQQPVVHQVRAGPALLLLVPRSGPGSDPRWRRLVCLPAHHRRRHGWVEDYVCYAGVRYHRHRHLHLFVCAGYAHEGQVAFGWGEGCSAQACQRQPDWYRIAQVPPQADRRGLARSPDVAPNHLRRPGKSSPLAPAPPSRS
jgi:hypothetical protein